MYARLWLGFFSDDAICPSVSLFENDGILTNSELTAKLIKKYCALDKASAEILKTASVKYHLSGRRYDRILKLARTIADLEGSKDIKQNHIMQALQYRITKQSN